MYDTSSFMPPQAPPIDRTPSGAAAFNSQPGVDASILVPDPGDDKVRSAIRWVREHSTLPKPLIW